MAYLPAMVVELAAYGFVAGLLMSVVHTRSLYADLYISLVAALVAGRILAGCAKALIFSAGKYSLAAWTTSYFITALPGLVIQLALIPSLVFALEKAQLIPVRYDGNEH